MKVSRLFLLVSILIPLMSWSPKTALSDAKNSPKNGLIKKQQTLDIAKNSTSSLQVLKTKSLQEEEKTANLTLSGPEAKKKKGLVKKITPESTTPSPATTKHKIQKKRTTQPPTPSLPVASRNAVQKKETTGFCNNKTRTIGNLTADKCNRLHGKFFSSQAAASLDLIRKKQILTQSRMQQQAEAAAQFTTASPSQPAMNTATIAEWRNKRDPGNLKFPDVATNLRDPDSGPLDPSRMRPDWEQAPNAPLPEGTNLEKLSSLTGDPRKPLEGNVSTESSRGYDTSPLGEAYDWVMSGDAGGFDVTYGTLEKFAHWGSDDGPLGAGGGEYNPMANEQPSDSERADPDGDDDQSEEADDIDGDEVGETYEEEEEEYDMDFAAELDYGTDPPDEDLDTKALAQGLTKGDGAGNSNRGGGQGQFTPPRNIGAEQHNREIDRRTRNVDIDPEDGDPDEIRDIFAFAGMNRDQTASDASTASPTVDGEGGSGPGIPLPNVDQSATSLMAAGSAGKPAVGDGGENGPDMPLPNIVESEMRH